MNMRIYLTHSEPLSLYEGGSYKRMYKWARAIRETRSRLIIFPSLDREVVPAYNRRAAEMWSSIGALVGVMTPDELTKWLKDIISRKYGKGGYLN
ncbi:hypothetical protein AB4Z50_35380 [Paenibacillus sp. 2TAB26]|uniref:hypothetical protein n=1 Tax=Paenibacillus sp. 2TAB26 TaxID=3233005 RepID=UPI003F9BAE91